MKLQKLTLTLLLLSVSISASSQRRVSADVQVKTLSGGKVTTVTKSVYCSNNGRLVAYFHTPAKYVMLTNPGGETRIYLPAVNEVMTPDRDADISSRDELLSIYMTGRLDDLGLSLYGYRAVASSTTEEGYLKKQFTASSSASPMASVEIVYDKYLPIYCEYTSPSGKVVRRLYLSHYTTVPGSRLTLPLRLTSIEYPTAKDSVIVRTLYSNVQVDRDDPGFDFEIPSDARAVPLPSPSKP